MYGALDDAAIDALLDTQWFGRVGGYLHGRTYVVPVAFAFDGVDAIYGYTVEGFKLNVMRSNPESLCFQVDAVDDLDHWRSVIVWGEYEELSGVERDRALALLLDRFRRVGVFGRLPGPWEDQPEPHGERERVVYRIRILERHGRFEQRAP